MKKIIGFLCLAFLCVLSQPHQSPTSFDIIDDITVNMFGQEHAEEDFTLVMDTHGIPLDWVLYGAYPWTQADMENIRQNVKETHARGLKYVHHIPIIRMYSAGGQQLADLRPELKEFCVLDINQEKLVTIFDGIDVYIMNLNEKGWQKFIKSEIRAAVDAGSDGILLDEIQAHTLYIGGDGGGTFNPVDMKGFRKFLKKTYSKQILSARYGIDNIDTFDYREYVLQNVSEHTWRTDPWLAPLWNEYRSYLVQSVLKVQKKIIRWAKKYAKKTYNKDIIFMGNTSDGIWMSAPFEINLDEAWLEYPYLLYGYPPRGKIIPSTKLHVNENWKKGTYLTQVPVNADLIARGHPPNITKVFWAEAYAANNECNVPLFVPGSSTEGYLPDLSVLSPYFRFIDTYREYYGKDWTWKPRIAIFYPLTSYMDSIASYMGAALALFEGGIQYDVIFSGDGKMMKNQVTVKQLQEYPVILLSNTPTMSKQQVSLILDYIAKGGTVLGWGGFGSDDELGNPATNRPAAWTNFWYKGVHAYGKGWFVNLSMDMLAEKYYNKRTPANRKSIIKAVTPYAPPEIESNAPDDVNFLVYVNSANEKLTLHMINYRYDIDTDSIKSTKKFKVTISLPDNFSVKGKKAKLYSPELVNPKNVKIQKVNNTTIRLKIPKLKYYYLLVIE